MGNFSESSKLFVNIVMASLIVGSSAATVSRTATRALSTTAAVKKESKMMDTFDHAVGPEKFELIAKQQGNDNLFDTYMVRPVPTQGLSANFPIPIPSEHDARIVGCSCEHDFKEV